MNDDIFETRRRLRREMLRQRESLVEPDWLRRSARIFERLQTYAPLREAKTVHCFISSPTRREVNTEPILTWLLAEGKTVFAPVVRGRSLKLARFHGLDALDAAPFGLREPKSADALDVSLDAFPKIDAVLTPLLVCDRRGNRLGYGKGFYDRFFTELSERRFSPQKIGLAFSFQVVDQIPQFRSDVHRDVPLDAIITDDGVLQTSTQHGD